MIKVVKYLSIYQMFSIVLFLPESKKDYCIFVCVCSKGSRYFFTVSNYFGKGYPLPPKNNQMKV